MAGRAREGAADEGRLLAVWEWSEALERDTGCVVQVSLYRSERVGVMRVTARLCEVVDGKPKGIRHQVRGEWPNASRAHLGDFLLALVMQLDSQAALPVFQQPAER